MLERTVDGGGGLQLAVFERNVGAAQTVLLVHGYPDDHHVWDRVADLLADRHHVVTYDVRGAGASGVPADVDGYRLDLLAQDMESVLDATVPALDGRPRQVHLVGHDWGSIQGWQFVCDDRFVDDDGASRFASYTSISGPHLDAVGALLRRRGPAPVSLTTIAYQAAKSWYVAAFQLPLLAPAFWRAGVSRRMWALVLERNEGVPSERLPDDEALTRTQANGANGVNLYRANVGSALVGPRPVHTNVPVQVIVPTADRYVTPVLATSTAFLGDDVSFVPVAGGHWLPLIDPDLVATLVTAHAVGHGG